jgi:glycosyltransferase involved in cell wall biosynthesis
LRSQLKIKQTYVVYNTTPMFTEDRPDTTADGSDVVLMLGTVLKRKGVTLFSRVADLARAQGFPLTFEWIGHEHEDAQGEYRSPAVSWLGRMEGAELSAKLGSAKVFFLSSIDDPFPLSVLEAMHLNRRVVCYKNVGSAELLRGVPGARVFDDYEPERAFRSICEVLDEQVDRNAYRAILRRHVEPSVFFSRMNEALATVGNLASNNAEEL